MADTVRIAVIGIGAIGPRHAQAIVECSDATLVALVGPGPRADDAARHFGVPLYESVEDLLRSTTVVDAAIVCTPNSTHVSISKILLAAKVHVLVEKPLSVDVTSGQSLVGAVRSSRAKLVVGHHRRFNPQVVAAKQALMCHTIGRPIAVSGLWMLCKPESYFWPPNEWRGSSEGGPILINGVHEIDTLQYLLGPIVRVHAEQILSQRQHEAEEGAAVLLCFASGVMGTILLCDAAPSPHSFESGTGENPVVPRSAKDFCRIFGADGVLSLGDMTVHKHRSMDGKNWASGLVSAAIDVGAQIPFNEQMAHFLRVVKGAEEPRCTAEEALRAVQVVEAIKKAMQTGQAVDIGDVRPKL